MDWLNALQGTLAVAIVVVTGLLGLQQGTVRTLRGSNGDLRANVGDLERERQELRDTLTKERLETKSKITELESAVQVLSSTVTGEAHLVALHDQLEEHHRDSMERLDGIRQALMGGGNGR